MYNSANLVLETTVLTFKHTSNMECLNQNGEIHDKNDKDDKETDTDVAASKQYKLSMDSLEMSYIWRISETLATFSVYFGLALTYGIMCQTLIDFEYHTSSSTEEVATIFTCRAVGLFFGSLMLGYLFDYIHHNLLMGVAMMLAGICNMLIPMFHNMIPIAVLFAIQAFPLALTNIGPTMVLMSHWSSNPGPFIQLLLLLYSLAGLSSPWIAKPFTSSIILIDNDYYNSITTSPNMSHLNSTFFNSNVSFKAPHVNLSDKTSNNILCQKFNSSASNCTHRVVEYSDLRYIYVLVGVYFLLCAVFCFLLSLKSKTWRPVLKSILQAKKITSDKIEGSDKSDITDQNIIIKVTFYYILMTLEVSLEYGFLSLLVTFIIKHLKWQKETAMYVSSIVFFSMAAMRLLVAVISKFLKSTYILIANLTLSTLALVTLSFFVNKHPIVMWVCTIVIGISLSTMLPTTLTLASSQIRPTGRIISIFSTVFSVGLVTGPTFLGYTFDTFGTMSFCYVLTTYSVCSNVLFVITKTTINYLHNKYLKDNSRMAGTGWSEKSLISEINLSHSLSMEEFLPQKRIEPWSPA